MQAKDVFKNGQGKELAVALGNLTTLGLRDSSSIERYILLS